MKKISKVAALLAILLGLGIHSIKVDGAVGDGFYNVPKQTTIEAGSGFSTTAGIKLVENGIQKNYSVYLYKSKTGYRKVSSSHFINRKVNGTYMLRYESASGKHKAWRRVTVKDTKAPTIIGANNKTINQYSKFSTTASVKAYDVADGNRGYSVYLWKNKTGYKKVSNKHYIKTKYVGKYQLKYVAKDRKGNTSVKYRKITVKAVAKKKTLSKPKPIPVSNTVRLNVSTYERSNGWWYDSNNLIASHSYRGEMLANIQKGTVVYLNGIKYQCYDKFVIWGVYPSYPGSSYSREQHFVGRGGKDASTYMADAPIRLATCFNGGYSQELVALLRPMNNQKFSTKSSMVISSPQ